MYSSKTRKHWWCWQINFMTVYYTCLVSILKYTLFQQGEGFMCTVMLQRTWGSREQRIFPTASATMLFSLAVLDSWSLFPGTDGKNSFYEKSSSLRKFISMSYLNLIRYSNSCPPCLWLHFASYSEDAECFYAT